MRSSKGMISSNLHSENSQIIATSSEQNNNRNMQRYLESTDKFQLNHQPFNNSSAQNSTIKPSSSKLLVTHCKLPNALIKIHVKEERLHMHHPVNKAIKLCNSFAIEAFLKQSTNYFTSLHCGNGKEIQNNIPPSKAAAIFKQQNNQMGLVDLAQVQILARQLQITLPKNNDLRGKAFLSHSKEKMYLKLFTTLN